jgi:hypothetical protein
MAKQDFNNEPSIFHLSFALLTKNLKRALGESCDIEFGNRRLVVETIYDTLCINGCH